MDENALRQRELELAEITAENVTHAAESLQTIRDWITFWSILLIIVGIIFACIAVFTWIYDPLVTGPATP